MKHNPQLSNIYILLSEMRYPLCGYFWPETHHVSHASLQFLIISLPGRHRLQAYVSPSFTVG